MSSAGKFYVESLVQGSGYHSSVVHSLSVIVFTVNISLLSLLILLLSLMVS